MKKILMILATLVAFTFTCNVQESQAAQEKKVWICASSSAYAYHSNPNCSGLSKCTKGIKQISISEAVRLGRRPCKICYK